MELGSLVPSVSWPKSQNQADDIQVSCVLVIPIAFFTAGNFCGESLWNIPPLVIRTASPEMDRWIDGYQKWWALESVSPVNCSDFGYLHKISGGGGQYNFSPWQYCTLTWFIKREHILFRAAKQKPAQGQGTLPSDNSRRTCRKSVSAMISTLICCKSKIIYTLED